jgi:hypothetical protein
MSAINDTPMVDESVESASAVAQRATVLLNALNLITTQQSKAMPVTCTARLHLLHLVPTALLEASLAS